MSDKTAPPDDDVRRTALPADYFQRPSPARVWDYWLGGKDNYPIDREVGDAVLAVNPQIADTARQCRRFLARAVRFLAAEAGIRQFLDVGTGLPTEQNTHEVAQAVAPDAKIVYVDNDPLVLAHARALLTNTTPEGVTTYIHADVREPEAILARAAETLDLTRPVALLLLGILGHAAPAYPTARDLTARLLAPLPAGSYLVLLEGVDVDETFAAGARRQAELGHPYQLRTAAEFAGYFDRLDVVAPGLVSARDWRPELLDHRGGATPGPAAGAHVGVGRTR
jgi:hypothetical protein